MIQGSNSECVPSSPQALLADNLPLAAEQYSTAVQVDELSMAANFGALECGLLGERPDVGEAEMQVRIRPGC